MSEAFDDYRNLVADRDQLLEHNAELRARVAELEQERDESDDQLRRRIQLLRTDNADLCAALAKREADEPLAAFTAWLSREMPEGTVISDPAWWAPKILRAVDRSRIDELNAKREAVAVGRLICDGGAWEFVPSASCPMNCDADLYMLSASQRLLSAAPCDVCGYNGPGYYQPSQHPCAASQQAAKPEPIPEENVIVWLADDPEAGPFYSRHDALIAWTEEKFYEGDNLVGLELRVQIATPMPDEILTITAVDEDGLITDFTEKQAAKGEGRE